MTHKEWIKIFNEEREEAVRSLDVEKFKEFYLKWEKRGIYTVGLPSNDRVIEISMRKMLYHMEGSTEEEKEIAANWLHEHGCSTSLNLSEEESEE